MSSSGILQVLGSVLLEGGPSSSASSAVMNVACTAIACLNNVAREDLALLQVRIDDASDSMRIWLLMVRLSQSTDAL
jgi:hypothetical protein